MDIYRFFHPHHNPRLHRTPLRQQELSELEQAASELRKALERAQQRNTRKAAGPILPSHFTDIIRAMRFVEQSMQTLCDAHEGDSHEILTELIHERSHFSGWDSWTSLVGEQLNIETSIAGNIRPTAQGPTAEIPRTTKHDWQTPLPPTAMRNSSNFVRNPKEDPLDLSLK